jgi:hypothetical protein
MFVAQAESNFSLVRYFAVSALGTSPTSVEIDIEDEYGNRTKGTKLCIRPRDMHSFRVTDPFLWLLAHWKLIRTAVPQTKRRDGVEEASIVAETETSVRLVLPDSKETLVIDHEYLGTHIIDPFSGTPVWIPLGQSRNRKRGGGLGRWFGLGKKPRS